MLHTYFIYRNVVVSPYNAFCQVTLPLVAVYLIIFKNYYIIGHLDSLRLF